MTAWPHDLVAKNLKAARPVWDAPDVPRTAWTCLRVIDLGRGGDHVCEVCGQCDIRYVHTMLHDSYATTFDVGCVCAGRMSGDLDGARLREKTLRNKASRRSYWLSRHWRTSYKGNAYLNTDGFILVVFESVRNLGKWSYGIGGNFSHHTFNSEDEAKLALFDAFYA